MSQVQLYIILKLQKFLVKINFAMCTSKKTSNSNLCEDAEIPQFS